MNPPTIDWRSRVRRHWSAITLVGLAVLLAELVQASWTGRLFDLRETLIYRGTGPLLCWLALPGARIVTHRARFDEPWPIRAVGLHLAGLAASCAVYWVTISLRRLVSNHLPLTFWPEVLRDIWTPDGWFSPLIGYCVIVLPMHARDFYVNWQVKQREASALQLANAQLETRLVRASLDALKMQLHPHFLFNTLNSITALIRRGRADEAEDIVAGLGELLRRSLEHKQDLKVTLDAELAFLRRYFEIERIRFQDRLQVEIDVPGDCAPLLVPSLILQPLVENAMKHGFSRDPAARVLGIAARREGDRLRLVVYNDGPAPAESSRPRAGTGIGLQNTRARLDMMYGPAARFTLRAEPPRGAVAEIDLPIQLLP